MINKEKLITVDSTTVLRYIISGTALAIAHPGIANGTVFSPDSAYNQISNSGFQTLLQSEEIKSKLLELYDRRYKRYLHIDASIDEKSEFHLKTIMKGDLQIFSDDDNIQPPSGFDIKKFEAFYPKLIREFSSILNTAGNALDSLRICQEAVHELLSLIRDELRHLKS